MSDHHTSYTINAMMGRLFLSNQAFRSLDLLSQQSIILDMLKESKRSDVNLSEILSSEYFSEMRVNDQHTIASIFKICSYCGMPKEDVRDYTEGYEPRGICNDCINRYYNEPPDLVGDIDIE